MPDQSTLDIASANHWFGFHPGMTQTQVRERLQQLSIEEDLYSNDNFAADVSGMHLEFWFEANDPQRLRQIATDGNVVWNERPVMNLSLDDALRAIEPLGRSPMWDVSDATDEPFADAASAPAGSVADEKLLENGTVWLPDRGFGLVVSLGGVMEIAWRELHDLPKQFAGPVTEAQRQLSKRPDLEKYLREKAVETAPKTPSSPAHVLLIWICIAMLGYVAYRGFQEMKTWNAAPTLTGKLVAVEEVPRKKHFDLGPEFLRKHMADDPVRKREVYRIQYLDPSGRQQTATLEGAEFYIPPRELGEEVEIAYVDGDPPRVKGLARSHDAAFIEYIPWAIAVGGFYIVGLFAFGIMPLTWRSLAELVLAAFSSSRRDSDYNRP